MSTLEKVIDIIRKNINTEAEINADTDMRKDLDIDSFDVLMIMNEIDSAYAIALDEEDFKKVNTPQEIVTLLNNEYGIHEI